MTSRRSPGPSGAPPFAARAAISSARAELELSSGGASAASGLLFPRPFRESLDGLYPHYARNVVDADTDPRKLRAEVDKEFKREGRRPSSEEISRRYEAILTRRKVEVEKSLRDGLRALHAMGLISFQANREKTGMSLQILVEFR